MAIATVPFAQLGRELQQRGQTVGALEAGAAPGAEIARFDCPVWGRKVLPQSTTRLRSERGIRKHRGQSHQEPMAMDARVPVIATVECGRQLPRW